MAEATVIAVDPPGTVLTNRGRCGCCCLCRGAGRYWSAVELEFGFAGESLPGLYYNGWLGVTGFGVGRDGYADARDTDLVYGTSLFGTGWDERHPCLTWKSSGTLQFHPEPLPGEGIDGTICGYRGPATEFISIDGGGGYGYGSAAMEWRYTQPRPGFPSAPALAYVGPPWPNLPTWDPPPPDQYCTLKGTAVSPGSYGGVAVPPYVSSHYDHTTDPLAFQFGCRPCTSDPHPAGTMTILYGWVPVAGDGTVAATGGYDFGYTADRAYTPSTTVLGWGPATLVAVEYVLDIDGQWVRNLYNSLGSGGFTGHRIPGFWRVKPAGTFKRCGACCDTPHRHRLTGRIVVPAGSPPGTPGPVLPVFGSPGVTQLQSPPGIDRHPDVPAQSWSLHMGGRPAGHERGRPRHPDRLDAGGRVARVRAVHAPGPAVRRLPDRRRELAAGGPGGQLDPRPGRVRPRPGRVRPRPGRPCGRPAVRAEHGPERGQRANHRRDRRDRGRQHLPEPHLPAADRAVPGTRRRTRPRRSGCPRSAATPGRSRP